MRGILFIFFGLLPILGFGQKIVIDLDYDENDSIIWFNNAAYGEQTKMIPIYTKVIPWSSSEDIPQINFSIIKAEDLDARYSDLINPKLLQSSPLTYYRVVFERKRPALQLSYVPFYLDEKTGSVKKVLSFAFEVEKKKAMAPLRSLKKGEFISQSVLATNDWFKIAISSSGIHKLSYEELVEVGLQNPALVRVYGGGAVYLSEDYSLGAYDDLSPVPIYMDKGSDGLFGPGDFILFYARGPVNWKYDLENDFYSQEVHPFSDNGYYFLTDGLGASLAPSNVALSSSPANQTVTTFDILNFREDRKYNLLNSGMEWYGDNYDLSLSGTYPFTMENLVFSEPLKIRVTAVGRSNEESYMKVEANATELGTFSFNPVNLSSYTSTFAVEGSKIFEYNSTQEVLTIQVEYLQPNSNSEAWLDHITLNGRANLRIKNSQVIFRDSKSVSPGNTSEFQLSNANSNTLVWEITNPNNPGNIPLTLNGSLAKFKLETSELREFIAFNKNGTFPAPIISGPGLGKIPNQDLHGSSAPDMLIVYAKEFEEQAQRLAEHRRNNDKLSVSLITQEQIFNEFSSGTPNVSALRNYLKMYYDEVDPASMTKYLLLFGDGSFDNKDTSRNNPNLIMTYQSSNSLTPTSSYVSDDFYGLLDTGEKLYDGMLDIGIGRLPVSNTDEAEQLVDKIIAYDQKSTIGEWRNYICLIGDDEDGNIHMKQANSLANYIETNYPNYNVNKIFLDAYPQVTTPTGDRYPDVTRAINDQMNRGALIINYTGHGGVTGLAHEKILDLTNIKGWNNEGRYPLFMTATCEFSRYDEYSVSKKTEVTSAGEDVLLNPFGGSIALFTTTRLVYSGPNHVLNEKFYEIVFEKNAEGDYYRLGDIIVYSKNNTGSGINKRNFTLLGDPSTSLSFPKNQVITDSINHISIEEINDTISALDFVTISGHMANQQGELLESFNGSVIPIVFDKKTNLKTLSNDGGLELEFDVRNNILYKGNVTVTDGRFSFGFYVPKDIGYNVGSGKISYYGFTENEDGHGSSTNLTIGGIGDFAELDTVGPSIELFMNDSLFRDGGIVTSSPELLAYVHDPFGINTTGNGIGHDITSMLNDDRINAVILNEYYLADKDSYSSGTVRYPYKDLPLGKHTVTVKVWDIFNNSATKSLDFIVVESLGMLLENIYNYPNPFFDETFFNIEHNRPGQELEVIIRIYDIMGNLVTILQQVSNTSGYKLEPLSWQGNSMGGATLGSGIYVYKVLVRDMNGEEAAGSGRLVIKR